ncbi:hypothetical protein A0U87_16315 [Sphingobium sp. MP9-4]|nr:hypothetical protein A0U87_16315 [Sphingobium sp. MP9-4]
MFGSLASASLQRHESLNDRKMGQSLRHVAEIAPGRRVDHFRIYASSGRQPSNGFGKCPGRRFRLIKQNFGFDHPEGAGEEAAFFLVGSGIAIMIGSTAELPIDRLDRSTKAIPSIEPKAHSKGEGRIEAIRARIEIIGAEALGPVFRVAPGASVVEPDYVDNDIPLN